MYETVVAVALVDFIAVVNVVPVVVDAVVVVAVVVVVMAVDVVVRVLEVVVADVVVVAVFVARIESPTQHLFSDSTQTTLSS